MLDMPKVTVQQLGVALGAVVEGVDLRAPVPAQIAEQLRTALDEHQVIAFRGQDGLTDEQQVAAASIFGVPGASEPMRTLALLDGKTLTIGDQQVRSPRQIPFTDRWHADVTYSPRPPTIGTLHAKRIPKVGGDTAFVSLCALYDSLSEPMKALCAQLQGEHTIEPMVADGFPLDERTKRLFPAQLHPLVIPHPRTGRKAIYIGAEKTWLGRLVGIHEKEANALLRYLRSELDNIEFQFRWKWAEGDLVVWDQRAVNHMGMGDHYAIDPYRTVFSVWGYPDDKPQALDPK